MFDEPASWFDRDAIERQQLAEENARLRRRVRRLEAAMDKIASGEESDPRGLARRVLTTNSVPNGEG